MRSLFLFICLALAGCGVLKAGPAPSTTFLSSGSYLTEMRDRAPFHGLWYRDRERFGALKRSKRSISVAPLELRFITERIASLDIPDRSKSIRVEEAEVVAEYLRSKFRQAVESYNNHPLRYTDAPDADSLIVEIAITELVPTNPVVNTLATAAGFLIPGTGLVKILAKGSVAIEGRVRDGATGEVWVEFKDRESDKASPLSVKEFQQYAYVRENIDDWAQQFAELSATDPSHMVEEASPISLSPI